MTRRRGDRMVLGGVQGRESLVEVVLHRGILAGNARICPLRNAVIPSTHGIPTQRRVDRRGSVSQFPPSKKLRQSPFGLNAGQVQEKTMTDQARSPHTADRVGQEDADTSAAQDKGKDSQNARTRLAAAAFEVADEGILILDASYRVLELNEAFCRLSGYSRPDIVGRDIMELASSPDLREQFLAIHEALRQEGCWQGELVEARKDGQLYPQWVRLRVTRDEQGEIANIIAFISDVSQRHQVEERLRYLTHYDELTGLANRSQLLEQLQEACLHIRPGSSLTLLYIDLDRFKILNDSLGHEVADRLLYEISRRLVQTVPNAEAIARLSGDEFAILLDTHQSLSSLSQIGSKLLSKIRKPILIENRELVISASIGISLMPEHARDPSALLRRANIAMQQAKHLGGNTLQFFTDGLRASSLEKLQMEHELRKAISSEQLEVFYQPRLDLHSKRIEAVEALVRWRHPERGLIAPGQFIDLAEETGLIIPLGEQVLRQACQQAHQWRQAGEVDLRVSVNLSVKQLRQGNFVSLVRQVLEETGLPPERLELELTESQLLDDIDNAINICRQLRTLGVQLAIDDFGTGYSSLSYLKRFPVNYVKIDRSFISELDLTPEGAAIAQAIIAMVHALGLKVVAEGVETQAQMDFLTEQGCDEVQGYLLCKPVEAPKLLAFIKSLH
ncbi:EAL domain-containing protein [Pseudomonas sp. ABC1]|nr:EAL domain-containing protein [Pseudomonas sp. ABC1]